MLRIDFVTLFPEMVLGAVDHSILKRAAEAGLVQFEATNPREFAHDAHRTVDDSPFGGGPGMVLKADILGAALAALPSTPNRAVVLTDPTGIRFDQATARELASKAHVVILCGHYEGIDDRVRERYATHVVSIGDFVLTGGELPALVIADSVVRLLPGALGCSGSLEADSHVEGLLSAPQFTRPAEFEGTAIPDVLTSGNHRAVEDWRRTQSLLATRRLRPDLFWRADLTKRDLKLMGVE